MSDAAEKSSRLASDKEALRKFNTKVVEDFRANHGKVASGPMAGAPLVVLTMQGAKSGKEVTIPLAYTEDGGRLVIIASFAGRPDNPSWYHNLKANPLVTVELGDERFEAQATEVVGEERDRLYAAQAAQMPIFNEYQAKAKPDRVIPVFVLDRM